jgi:hypothetical protein
MSSSKDQEYAKLEAEMNAALAAWEKINSSSPSEETEKAYWAAFKAAEKAFQEYTRSINSAKTAASAATSTDPGLTGFGGMRRSHKRKSHTKRRHHSKRRRTVRRR